MINLKKMSTGLFLSFTLLALSACPRPDDQSAFGSCSRLSNCLNVYSSSPEISSNFELQQNIIQAVNNNDSGQCSQLIIELSTAVKQGCPF